MVNSHYYPAYESSLDGYGSFENEYNYPVYSHYETDYTDYDNPYADNYYSEYKTHFPFDYEYLYPKPKRRQYERYDSKLCHYLHSNIAE